MSAIPEFAPRAHHDGYSRHVLLWCTCGCGVTAQIDLIRAPYVGGRFTFEESGIYPQMRAAHAAYYRRFELPPSADPPVESHLA